ASIILSPVSFPSYCCSTFYFSSRRRHTRSKRDWSSDVCSSDLVPAQHADSGQHQQPEQGEVAHLQDGDDQVAHRRRSPPAGIVRSEERRVGKGARCQRITTRYIKKS